MIKKGIILAGGTGSRLAPLTSVVNKHLLPINERFIIDYPINTLKQMGVTNISIILGGEHFDQVVSYLKDGSDWGVTFNYVYQGKPVGIAQAINICQPYVESEDSFCVILGDNIFQKPIEWQNKKTLNPFTAKIALCNVPDLNRFGVASIDHTDKIIKIEEKPITIDENLRNYAITGCYLFNRDYFNYFQNIDKSARGEYEITDIIKQYISNNDLQYSFNEGWWSDAGTFESIDLVRSLVKKEPVKF